MLIMKSAIVAIITQFSIKTCAESQHSNNSGVDSFLLNLNEKLKLEFKKI